MPSRQVGQVGDSGGVPGHRSGSRPARSTGRDGQQGPPVARRVRGDGAPGEDVLEPGGDVGVLVEAEHGVGLGQRLGELLPVPLGQAADGDHGLRDGRADLVDVVLELGRGEQGVDRVLLGRLDEAAGVDQHGVGVGGVVDQRPALAASRPASSSLSVSLRAQPRVTTAKRREGRRGWTRVQGTGWQGLTSGRRSAVGGLARRRREDDVADLLAGLGQRPDVVAVDHQVDGTSAPRRSAGSAWGR